MKCYVADKSIEDIKRELSGGTVAVSAVQASRVVEMPLSIPTMPYYNSMALTTRIGNDTNAPVTIADMSCAFNVIFVIGVGGTGGYLVRDLARYVSTLPYAKTTLMILMDQDEVEVKNINRQNFITKDIGKNKAEVLATRYASAFGIKIVHIPTHLTDKNIHEIISSNFLEEVIGQHLCGGNIPTWDYGVNIQIASCVDNNKTRALISNYLGLVKNPVMHTSNKEVLPEQTKFTNALEGNGPWVHSIAWIDSGNETHNGQVVCYYNTLMTSDKYHGISGGETFGLPTNDTYASTKISDVAESTMKTPGQFLSGYMSAGVTIKDLEQDLVTVSSSYRNTTSSTPDQIATKAAKLWLLQHKMGTFGLQKHGEFMKMIKELDPMDLKFNEAIKYVLAKSIRDINDMRMNMTFPVTYLYPGIWDLADDKLNTEMSCAERSVADPQNIMVNIKAAGYMLDYFSKILASNPKNAMLDSFGVSWNKNQSKEWYMTESNLKEIFSGMMQHITPTLSTTVTKGSSTRLMVYKQGNKTFTTVN